MARGRFGSRGEVLRGRRDECAVLDGLLEEPGRDRAGCWSCGEKRGSGRRRCSGTRSGRRRICGCCARLGWRRRWSLRSRRCISCARRCSIASIGFPRPQRDALATTFGLSAGRCRIGSSSAWRCWVCCRRWPRSARSCAWSTMRSGWTGRLPRRWRLWPAGCWRSRWWCCSRRGSRARNSQVCRSWWSRVFGMPMRGRCWRR